MGWEVEVFIPLGFILWQSVGDTEATGRNHHGKEELQQQAREDCIPQRDDDSEGVYASGGQEVPEPARHDTAGFREHLQGGEEGISEKPRLVPVGQRQHQEDGGARKGREGEGRSAGLEARHELHFGQARAQCIQGGEGRTELHRREGGEGMDGGAPEVEEVAGRNTQAASEEPLYRSIRPGRACEIDIEQDGGANNSADSRLFRDGGRERFRPPPFVSSEGRAAA